MESKLVTRREYIEFKRRTDEEHARQNHRISEVEESLKQLNDIALSVERLAITMEQMLHEQQEQGKRLEVLESIDGERWRTVSKYVLTTILGLIIGFIFKVLMGE